MFRIFARLLLVILLAVVLVILINTLRFGSRQRTGVAVSQPPPISAGALEHFQALIRFKTISHIDPVLFDATPFLELQCYLQQAYPLVHLKLEREVISNYTLLYHWKGTDSSLPPLLLMAHMDVVPVEETNLSSWKTDPFAGTIKDSCIWGRGTWDNKINIVSMLEATEKLLVQQVQPRRSVYFLFSHDEELGGKNGTHKAAELFSARGIYPDLVIDEGGIVTTERIPGVNKQVALIGTAEKGMLTLQLKVEKQGGHSSMPERETAIDILTAALGNIHKHPFDSRLAPAQQDFIRYLGPELSFLKRMAFANTWLFERLIIGEYEKTSTGNAMVRTTMTPTILHSGIKENIVPSTATALINLRLLSGDSVVKAVERVSKIINDARVKVTIVEAREPSASTPVDGQAFQKVETLVRKTFPDAIVTPFLLVGGTDSHHFKKLARNIIRFTPAIDPQNFHGANERVSLRSFRHALWFYEQLLLSETGH